MNEYIPFVVVVRPIEGELEVPVLVNHPRTIKPAQYLVLYIKQLRESHDRVLCPL